MRCHRIPHATHPTMPPMIKNAGFAHLNPSASDDWIAELDYLEARSEMCSSGEDIFNRAYLIVKVKEPLQSEWPFIAALRVNCDHPMTSL